MPQKPFAASKLLHKALATASGAAGGAFGLVTLPVELTISKVIMLRSIADIARSEGEDPSDLGALMRAGLCIGGRSGSDDASESGYFAVRSLLAKTVTEAARFIAERGVIKEGGSVLLRFITQIASRFGVVVTQKVVAQAWSSGRRRRELCFHGTFSGCSPRSLYRSTARAHLRQRIRPK